MTNYILQYCPLKNKFYNFLFLNNKKKLYVFWSNSKYADIINYFHTSVLFWKCHFFLQPHCTWIYEWQVLQITIIAINLWKIHGRKREWTKRRNMFGKIILCILSTHLFIWHAYTRIVFPFLFILNYFFFALLLYHIAW